jgi:riboflavin synthase
MFTGIVQHVGGVQRSGPSPAGRRLHIDVGPLAEGLALGDSVAVNGVCLTASELAGSVAGFDVIHETLRRTNLGRLAAGSRVNLERALRADGRLDGHIVQGHVDGSARVERIDRTAGQWVIHFAGEKALTDEMVAKGSIAIDGVSLTLAGVSDGHFQVALIPTTLEKTTLSAIAAGDLVNIETDILGKYVRRLLDRGRAGGALTLETLRENGFA